MFDKEFPAALRSGWRLLIIMPWMLGIIAPPKNRTDHNIIANVYLFSTKETGIVDENAHIPKIRQKKIECLPSYPFANF